MTPSPAEGDLQEHAACSCLPFGVVLAAVPGQLRGRHEREAGQQGREKASVPGWSRLSR